MRQRRKCDENKKKILTAAAERVGRRTVVALWRKDFANMAVM